MKKNLKKLSLLNDGEMDQLRGGQTPIPTTTCSTNKYFVSRCDRVATYTVMPCVTIEVHCPKDYFINCSINNKNSIACPASFIGIIKNK